MKKINVLDCTLRDGGYVNNWEFGYDHILQVRYQLEKAGVNIIELGFMRDEEYKRDRAIYNSTEQVKQIIGTKKSEIIYSALIEMANYYPLNMLNDRSPRGDTLVLRIKIEMALILQKAPVQRLLGMLVGRSQLRQGSAGRANAYEYGAAKHIM